MANVLIKVMSNAHVYIDDVYKGDSVGGSLLTTTTAYEMHILKTVALGATDYVDSFIIYGTSTILTAQMIPTSWGTFKITSMSSSVKIGSTIQLSSWISISSGDISIQKGTVWTSSNNSIATVSSSGLVTGISNGVVTIKGTSGTYSDGSPYVGTISITVENNVCTSLNVSTIIT